MTYIQARIRARIHPTPLLLRSPLRLHAQELNGCADSPENPTRILGLIVGAAGLAYSRLRHSLCKRERSGRER